MTKKEKPLKIETKTSIVDLIMDIPLFDSLDGRELKTVARHMSYFEIQKGEVLFKEGDPGDYLCFVIEGGLDILKEAAAPGTSVVISTITRKRPLGEMSVIDNTTRSATARARTHTSLVSLPKTGFEKLLVQNPIIGIKILKGIARWMSMNMRRTSSLLADYMLPST